MIILADKFIRCKYYGQVWMPLWKRENSDHKAGLGADANARRGALLNWAIKQSGHSHYRVRDDLIELHSTGDRSD